MARPSFKIGDKVHLRSGGPSMMVEKIKGNAVECIWFDKKDALHTARFSAPNLEKVRDVIAEIRRQIVESPTD